LGKGIRGFKDAIRGIGVLRGYYLKGGGALEIRFATGARATEDMDIGLDGERSEGLKRFESALALVWFARTSRW
jgi:hypothetical protein